jgi:hypothetical protein
VPKKIKKKRSFYAEGYDLLPVNASIEGEKSHEIGSGVPEVDDAQDGSDADGVADASGPRQQREGMM